MPIYCRAFFLCHASTFQTMERETEKAQKTLSNNMDCYICQRSLFAPGSTGAKSNACVPSVNLFRKLTYFLDNVMPRSRRKGSY